MFNLLKMDLYRLFKTKSYYVIAGILAFFIFMMMYSMGELIQSGYSLEDMGADFGTNGPDLLYLLYNLFNNELIPMIVGIGAAMYICTDYSSGYIKNIASSVKYKTTIAVSKFLTLVIGVTIYFILMILLTYLLGNAFIGNVVVNDLGSVLQYSGMSLFLNIVIVSLVILAASFFRSSAATITTLVVILLCAQLGYQVLDKFLGINLMEYSPILNIMNLTPQNTELWSTIFISGLGFLVVYIAASLVVMEKKDIT